MNKEKLKGLQSFLKDDIWRVTEDEVVNPVEYFIMQ